MKIAIGIDVHKKLCAAYAVRKDNHKDKSGFLEEFNSRFRRFRSNEAGFKEFEEYLGHDHEVHILIENSTKTHDVYWMLKNMGYDVVVAHAADLYRITKSNAKNDDHDAMELAHYMRRRLNGENEFQESFIPNKEQMRRRKLCRFLADQKNELSTTKKQVRAYALLNGIGDFDNVSDIATRKAIDKLAKLNTSDPLPKMFAQSMSDHKKLIDFTRKVIEQEFYSDRTFEIIFSIPGFGVHSAAYLSAEIIDISRFETPQGFSSYFGVRPSQKDSADSKNNRHISHRGDALARRLVYQATFVHVTNCPDSHITQKYHRLKARGKHHREAVVACSNSMLMMIHTLIREDRVYSCDGKDLAKARVEAERMGIDYEGDEVPEDPNEEPAE